VTGREADRIAASFEADPALLPHLPYLFQDLPSLGCSPAHIVALARRAGARAGNRVADLCCGKGDSAIALARELRCGVVGVDLSAGLIALARQQAGRSGLEDLCRFEVGDVRLLPPHLTGFDGVVFAAASPALGTLRETVARLRDIVRPGGWMIIEDGVAAARPKRATGRRDRDASSHTNIIREITTCGDSVEAEILVPSAQRRRRHAANTAAIRRRALELARRFPEVADLLLSYPERQAQRNHAPDRRISALWLLRRSQVAS